MAKYLTLIIVGDLVVLALVALGASWISYASVSRVIVGSAPDANQLDRAAESLSRKFPGIVVRLRVCSAGFLLAAVLITGCRRRFQIWIEQAVLPLPQFLRAVVGSLGRGLKADGKLNASVLLALSLLGVVLRVRFLFRPISLDEADTFLQFASRPLYVGLSWYPVPNNHLLYTLLSHFSWRLFGDAEWAIRLPALFAGSLLIPVTYWAARVLYDRHSALIAVSMVTASSPLIDYSVSGRGYIVLCVLFLLLLITSQHLLKRDSEPAWLLWALIAALGFYTIPTMLYAAGTAAMWLALSSGGLGPARPSSPFLTRVVSALACTAAITTLLYLPVLIASGWQPLLLNQYVHSRSLAYLLANFPMSVSATWAEWTQEVPPALVWILSAGFVMTLVFHQRKTGHRVQVAFAAALCIPPLLLVQRVVPFPRVWLFLLPLCAAISGAGLWLVVRRLVGRNETRSSGVSVAIALSFCLVMCSPDLRGRKFSHNFFGPAVEDCVVWMSGRLTPRDVVVARIWAAAPLSYYFRRHGVPLVSHTAPCDPDARVYTSNGPLTGKPATSEMRVLAVSSSGAKLETVLSAACLTGQRSSVPRLVYDRGTLRVYESYVGPGAQGRLTTP